LTVGGVGLIVMVFVIVWGMSEGLQKVFKVEADPANLLVVSQGSNAETTSGFAKETLKIISSMDGADRDAKGEVLASGELYVIINTERRGGTEADTANLCVRGVSAQAPKLRAAFKIAD